jgi:23S rRNA (pseudouridine1915-N3)-methyltransferase
MQLLVVAVGRLRPALREVGDDYLLRLSKTVKVDEREVKEAGRVANPAARREEEDRRILGRIPDGTPVTLLDPGGTLWSSEQLAEQLDRWRLDARDRALVVGGAAGVGTSVRARADQIWSLGPMTLPHELARVIVLEQLYRAGTILRGEPYHRGNL